VSVEDQKRADRILDLVLVPAALRFVSLEPLLGDLKISHYLTRRLALSEIPGSALNDGCSEGRLVGVDWVIVGGESGPRARGCNVAWIRSIVDQCRMTDTACFVKQLGSNPIFGGDFAKKTGPMEGIRLRDKKGGDPAEWPEDMRVRQFPKVS
jgi:protein gp37